MTENIFFVISSTCPRGAANEDDAHLSGDEQETENNEEDLDALAAAQHRKKKQKLWHPWPQQTEHSVMRARNSIRYGCHVVTFHSNRYSVTVPNRRQERKCVICSGPHWASQCPEKQGKPDEKKGEARAHSAYSKSAMAVHTETSMFAREALETRRALIDCGATRSMGSCEAPDGLARMNEQRHGSTRFPWITKKTWYTLANVKRQQSEGEVASKVNAGGRTERLQD